MSIGIFDNRRPLYQLVAEQLIEGIESGEYPVGGLLPSEAQLCDKHGVSRHTVRAAIRELSDRGMLSAQPGIGTRILSQQVGRYKQVLKEISDLTGYVGETNRRILKKGKLIASDAGIQLPGDPKAEWHMYEAVSELKDSGEVIAWARVFVLPKYKDALKAASKNKLVRTSIEELYGIRPTILRQAIKACVCPQACEKWLNVKKGSAVLSVVREFISGDEVYEVAWLVHPPESFETRMELVLSR